MNKEDYLISKLSSKYIGDDGAMVDGLIYSMDAFFENVHFKRDWMSLKQIARKAMLVNISDAIAMNAEPLYALVTLALPKEISKREIDEIVGSLHGVASEYGCEIVGGDTIVGERLDFSITIISKSQAPLRRVGLEEGDMLAYTGELGESKRDLTRLFNGESISHSSRFIEPILRQEFIKKSAFLLKAGMDISDGLFCDTNKILEINGLGMELKEPITDEVGSSGEEYEMLVGFSEENLESILAIAKETSTPLTLFATLKQEGKRFECQNHHI